MAEIQGPQYRSGEQVKRAIPFKMRIIDAAERIVDFIGSDESIDRFNTKLRGWVTDAYENGNPVVLWSHNQQLPPIGRTIALSQDRSKRLRFRVQFTPADLNEFGFRMFKMIEAGFLRAVSVGFIPKEAKFIEPEEEGQRGYYELRDNELLELSVVPVPANPNALAMARGMGLIQEEENDLFVLNRMFTPEMLGGTPVEELRAAVMEWAARMRAEDAEASDDTQDETDFADTDTTTEGDVPTSLSFELRDVEDDGTDIEDELIEAEAEIEGLMAELGRIRDVLSIVVDATQTNEAGELAPVATVEMAKQVVRQVSGGVVRDEKPPAGDDELPDERAGRVLSKRNVDRLTSAQRSIQAVLDDAGTSDSSDEEPERSTTGVPPPVPPPDDTRTERFNELADLVDIIADRVSDKIDDNARVRAFKDLVGSRKRQAKPKGGDLYAAADRLERRLKDWAEK